MGKKDTDVDSLLDDDTDGTDIEDATPVKAAKKSGKKGTKKPPTKKVVAKKTPAPAKKIVTKAAAPAKKAKAAGKNGAKKSTKAATPRTVAEDSPIRKALLKVRRPISYADFSDANDFNIRTVRRMARDLCATGELDRVRDGQVVMIRPAV